MSQLTELIQQIDELKNEIEALRPISWEQEQRIMQKFRLDWNYHSNAIEGNTLTYGETKAFLLHGITAQGKPFRDYLDIKGHQAAIEYLQDFIKGNEPLTEAHIRELHKVLLIEPYEMDAITANGYPTKRRIEVGRYKSAPNSVQTSTGELHVYASPEETPAKMGDLMRWYRGEVEKGESHPLLIAALFHLRFVEIHPFDDGNGRMSRLLMNLILMQQGYVPVIINTNSKPEYILALEKADAGDEEDFIKMIGTNLVYSLDLFIRGAKGERIEELDDLDKRLRILQKRIAGKDQIGQITRNVEQQIYIFDAFIQPFLSKLGTWIDLMKPSVETTEFYIVYWSENPKYLQTSQPLNIKANNLVTGTEELKKIFQTDPQVRGIEMTCKITHIKNTDLFSYDPLSDNTTKNYLEAFGNEQTNLTIRFEFGKQKFIVSHNIQDYLPGKIVPKAIVDLKWQTASAQLYGYEYSEEETNKLAMKIFSPIVERLEKNFKR